MIPVADRFELWSDDIKAVEPRARLRSPQAITRLYCGPRGNRLTDELRRAERDASHLPAALAVLDALAVFDRRSVLGRYTAVRRPA